MKSKKLKCGFEIPVYGLGTWMMGGDTQRDEANDDNADIAAIEAAIERGVSHIDSAESYASGHAERLIGKAIQRFDRESVFIATKFSARNAARENVELSLENSLRRLGVDYVDLYMLHSFSKTVPLKETIETMNSLVDKGKIRWIGVSNFGPENLSRAQKLSHHPIVVNQVHYNVAVREAVVSGLVDYCQANDVILSAWKPLDFDKTFLSSIKEIASKYARTPQQIALSWLTSQKSVVTVSKTRSISHLEENIDATLLTIEPTDFELIARLKNTFSESPIVRLDN